MFDINGAEILVILVIALVIVGPERLPKYAAQFRAVVRKARDFTRDAESSVRTELGDADLASLDPRQYDPRRIVRDVMADDPAPSVTTRPTGPAKRTSATARSASAPAPFDPDAT